MNIKIAVILSLCIFSSCVKSMETIMQDKENEGYTIISRDDHGFLYADSKTIRYFKYNEGVDSIIYEDGKTLIRLYEPKLIISNEGEIYAEKDFSDDAYKGYLEYFDGSLMKEVAKLALTFGILTTDTLDKPYVFPGEGFIVTHDSRKFYFCPKGNNIIEALLVDDEAGYEISEIQYNNREFLFNYFFRLTELPAHLRPQFTKRNLNSLLYDSIINGEYNQFGWFKYSCKVTADGKLIQGNNIYSKTGNFSFTPESLKDQQSLRTSIERHEEAILAEYHKYTLDIAIENARDLKYYYYIYSNKNLLTEMFGKTCYVKATVNYVSEKDDEGKYYIRFDEPSYDRLFYHTVGYSYDDSFSRLYLPADVIFKATMEDTSGIYLTVMVFRDIELLGTAVSN